VPSDDTRYYRVALSAAGATTAYSTADHGYHTYVRPNQWVTNGPVKAMYATSDTLYLGGNFTEVGPATGGFVGLDPTSGAQDVTLPVINGDADAIVSDGSGGWYIGGLFSKVDGYSITNLVHLRADGTVDTTFAPSPTGGQVSCLVLSGTTLYLGGTFSAV